MTLVLPLKWWTSERPDLGACRHLPINVWQKSKGTNKTSIFYLGLSLGFHFRVWPRTSLSFARPAGRCSEKNTAISPQDSLQLKPYCVVNMQREGLGSFSPLLAHPRNGRKLTFSRDPATLDPKRYDQVGTPSCPGLRRIGCSGSAQKPIFFQLVSLHRWGEACFRRRADKNKNEGGNKLHRKSWVWEPEQNTVV